MQIDMRTLIAEARALASQKDSMSVKEGAEMISRLADTLEKMSALQTMVASRDGTSLTTSGFLNHLAPPKNHEAEVVAAWADHFAIAGSRRRA